jgi:hypothetical protein
MPDASDKVFGTHRIAQTWIQNLYNWVVLIRLVVGNNITVLECSKYVKLPVKSDGRTGNSKQASS